MTVCPQCGSENRERARFCDTCGAPLDGTTAAAREQRKVVTVLFCDVIGSTALGERLDPESLRRVLARYFEETSAAIERHGGTVEKFIGDAVMAVFGVPVVHEDDALRCVRAAADVRAALGPLNVELERDFGTKLEVRIGVATGEVVTGTEERLATGDAVNVAARLEQAAEPGEILLGEETVRLLREAVEVEELQPLHLKGKQGAEPVYRLLSVHADASTRRLDAPIVGRTRELSLLANAWDRVVSEGSCHLFTVLGVAGVGKSRIVLELLDSLPDATVVRGRCLSYGEGITYWPVVEVLKQLPELSALGLDARAHEAIRSVLLEEATPVSREEIAWAVRKALEAAARSAPLVCVFDDLHWGEETFLDLVEHVADLSRDAPIFLLCMARPELLDRRPGWAGGKLNATNVLLEPLSEDETGALIEELLGGERIDAALEARIREAAEGNALFVEEMVAMLRDAPAGEIVVPPTIQALLAARIDQLEPSERAVLERGAVEGRVFHRGAVEALAPHEGDVFGRLIGLVRKELVRPERAVIAGEEAFRFRHLLIRDAAYEGLPKAQRVELHERFSLWLEEHGADLVELDEIVGYHLEQAYRYRAELGPLDESGEKLGARAAGRLAAAGKRALARDDVRAAISLLQRSHSLDPEPIDVGLALAEALYSGGRGAEAADLAGVVARGAAEAGNRVGELTARLDESRLGCQVDPSITAEDLLALAGGARASLEAIGDDRGLAAAAMAEAWALNAQLQMARMADAAARVVEHARRAGDRRRELTAETWLVVGYFLGPMPVDEALRALESRPELDSVVPYRRMARAVLCAMVGRFDDARALTVAERARLVDEGAILRDALVACNQGKIEHLARDLRASAAHLREGCDGLEAIGDHGFLSTYVAELGQTLYELGDYEGARRCALRGEAIGAADDLVTQMLWRQLRARVLAHDGDHAAAERLAREAVRLGEPTDALEMRADSRSDLAEVLTLCGRLDDAATELEQALDLYRQKGITVMVARTEERLERLRSDAT